MLTTAAGSFSTAAGRDYVVAELPRLVIPEFAGTALLAVLLVALLPVVLPVVLAALLPMVPVVLLVSLAVMVVVGVVLSRG